MNEERLRDLFEQVIELAPEARAEFMVCACRDDLPLQEELDALLAADAAAVDEEFWQHSAFRLNAIADQPMVSAVGETIGQYRLVELIGKGGMGAVYRAVRIDAEFDKCVAIKLIDPFLCSPEVIAQFRAERQILANLEHPNIARLLDGGARADGLPYPIMEYIEGILPSEYCRVHNLSVAQRLVLFRKICSAVHFAHQNMVIHRDLKPANILVIAEGAPKLLDFGIAKVLSSTSGTRTRAWPQARTEALTQPASQRLTVRYASPEQVRGEPVTTATDVYSLGVVLYELLTEHSPYGADDRAAHQILHTICEEEPARPSVWSRKLRGDLDNIVLRAMRKSPLDRYASVDQFSDDIRRHLEGRPILARGDAPLYLAAKFIRRNRMLVIAAVLLLCSLVGGLIEVTLARARADRRFNDVRKLAHSVMFDYADAIDRLPGATPVKAQLLKDALTYLDNLSKEADTPQLEREIVDAYVRVSDVQGNEYENNLGDTAASIASAQKAVAAAEKLLKEDQTALALSSSANAFSTHGSLLYSTGDLPAADRAYQRVIVLREQIAKQSPGDLENNIALSTCFRHLGDLYGGHGFQNLGKTAQSLEYYEKGKALDDVLMAQYPGNVDVWKESYKTLLSLSAALNAVGKRDDAAKDLTEALVKIQAVSAAEPQDTSVKVELAIAESGLGQMLLDGRDATGAIPHFARSVDLLERLLDADPKNAIYRRGQSIVETEWAAALRGAGQVSEGVQHNEKALRLAQALSGDAPQSTQYRVDVGTNERKLSEALLAAGNQNGALHEAEGAEQILCQSFGKSTNKNTSDTSTHATNAADPNSLAACDRSLLAVGNAHLALHNIEAAKSTFQKAEGIASFLSRSDLQNAIYRSDWARAQAALAGALVASGENDDGRTMYAAALKNWSMLRDAKSLTAEDSHRSEIAAKALAAVRPRRRSL